MPVPHSQPGVSRLLRLGILTSLLSLPAAATAQSVLWTGGTNTSWLEATNWSPASVPSATDIVTLANGDSVLLNGAANTATADLLSITDGLLTVDDATLTLTTGINLGALGELDIRGGVLTSDLGGATTITGVDGAQLIFAETGGGTFDHIISGAVDLIVQAGTTELTTADTFTGALDQTTGTLSVTQAHRFTDSTLTSGNLGGTGDVTFDGSTAISRYYINRTGLTTFAGTTTLSRTGTESYKWLYLYPGSDVENSGTFTFSDADGNSNDVYLYLRGDSSSAVNFTNLADATLHFSTGASPADIIYVDGSSSAYNHFVNLGLLNVSSTGDGSTVFDGGTTFTNAGTLNLNSGTLVLQGPSDGASTGAFNVAAGATLELDANVHTFGNGATLNGAGTLDFAGGSAVFDSGSTLGIEQIDFGFGALTANADLTISGDTIFRQFYLSGPGVMTLTGSGAISRSGSTVYQWVQLNAGAHLRNAGDFTVTDTGNSGNDAHLYLRGTTSGDATFTNLADATLTFHTGGESSDRIFIDGSSTAHNAFFNYGSITVSADGPDSRTTFDWGVSFENHGELYLTGGSLVWQGNSTAASTGDFVLSGGAVLHLDSGQQSFGSGADISGAGTFLLGGSTATFNAGSTLTTDQVKLTNGTLVAAADLTLTGDVDIYQSYLSGPGTLTLSGMTNLARAQGGAYEWIQLNPGAAIANAGMFSLSDFHGEGADTHIYLAGNSTGGDATFTNLAGATLDFSTGEDALDRIWFNGSSFNHNHVLNQGTLNVSSTGNGRVTVTGGATFTNDGTVSISGGALILQGGSNTASTGSFTVFTGATLEFAGRVSELAAGASVSGSGTTAVSSGTARFLAGATLDTDHLELTGGILELATGQSFQNANLTGGRLQNDGTSTFAGTVTFTQFDFDGPGTARFNGTSTLSRSGSSPYRWIELNYGATVENAGTFTISDTDASAADTHIYLRGNSNGAATFTNLAGATLDLNLGADAEDRIYFDGSSATYNHILNAGTLNLSSTGDGYAEIDSATTFDNTGEINVSGATFYVHAPTDTGHTGTFNLHSGSVYAAAASSQTFANGAAVAGTGTFRVAGATVNFDTGASLDADHVEFINGHLGGTADLNIPGSVDLHQFYFDGPGSITLGGDSTLARTGSEAATWFQLSPTASLANAGTLTVSDAGGSASDAIIYLRGNSSGAATFTNLAGATLIATTGADSADEVVFDGSSATYNHLVNAGTFTASSAGDGRVLLDTAMTFDNTGTVNVDGGTLELQSLTDNGSSGTWQVAAGAILEFSHTAKTFLAGTTITGDGLLRIDSNATADFADATTLDIASITLSNGNLSGAGALTLNGDVTLTDSTIAGSGLKTFAGNTTIARSGSAGHNDLNVTAGSSILNTGHLTLADYDSHGNHVYIHLNGRADLGTVTFTNAGTLTTFTETDSDDRIIFDGYTAAHNLFLNTGTWDLTGGAGWVIVDHGMTFTNSGIVNLGAGRLTLQGGDGGSTSGTFNVAAGATLDLDAADYTFTPAASLAGDGTLEVSLGTTTLQSGATFSLANLVINGGSLALPDGAELDQLTVTSGDLELDNASSANSATLTGGKLTANAALTLNNATLGSFDFYGSGPISLGGTSTYERPTGVSSRYLDFNAGVDFTNTGDLTLIEPSGAGGTSYHLYLRFFGDSTAPTSFTNTGTLTTTTATDSDDRVIFDGTGNAHNTFTNAGTWNLDGTGPGYVIVDTGLAFTNTGTVNLNIGRLILQGGDGGSTAGDFLLASDTILDLDNGSFTFTPTASVTGAGNLQVSSGTTATFQSGAVFDLPSLTLNGGTLTLNDGYTLDTLTLSSGALNLPGETTVTTFTQTSGTLDTANTFTVTGSATLIDGVLAGAGTKTLAGASTLSRANGSSTFDVRAGTELVNSGTFTLSDPDGAGSTSYHTFLGLQGTSTDQAIFRNTGTVTIANPGSTNDRVYFDGDNAATSLIYNEGTFNVTSTGSGQTIVDSGTSFFNSGTLSVQSGELYLDGLFTQTAGITEVTGGTLFKRNSPLQINGGVLRGTGTIVGDVEFNGGELAPGLSPGTLTIDGDLILYSGSLFTIEITGAIAGIDYDVVNVTGNMDLSGGVIELAFSNNYAPSPGDTFNFFNVNGTFTDASDVTVTGLLPGWTFDTSFDALSGTFALTSTSFAAVPEPSTWALMITGCALILLVNLRRRRR